MLVPLTRTTEFNKSLEIQQSICQFSPFSDDTDYGNCSLLDLLASYNVANQITAIEDMIAQGAEMQTVLRLLCLASITSGGIKTKILERIKRDFLQVRARIFRELLNQHHCLDIWVPPFTSLAITRSPSPLYTPTQPPPGSYTIRACCFQVPFRFTTQVAPASDRRRR